MARQDGLTVSFRADLIRIGDIKYRVDEMSAIPDKYKPKEDPKLSNEQDSTHVTPATDPTLPQTNQQKEDGKSEAGAQGLVTRGPLDQQNGERTELRGGRICFSGATSFLSNFFLVCFVFLSYKV